MTLRLSPGAEADVDGVLAWYRERGHDLAGQFLGALDQCLDFVARNPLSFALVHGDIRRALLRRFPYCVFYVVSDKEIVVLACLHGHRDPELWKELRDA